MSFIPEQLHVVTAIANPARFHSRWALYRDFERHVLATGATLTTVEVAFGERKHEVTEAGNPRHIQLRTSHELWLKENLLNIGISRLPSAPEARYIAWVDADIQFTRPDWAVETIHQLQHYDIVQMFSHAQDLGPAGEPLGVHEGFVQSYQRKRNFGFEGKESGGPEGFKSLKSQKDAKPQAAGSEIRNLKSEIGNYPGSTGNYGGPYWHPGFAWAARRESLDKLGGLIDYAILGSADHHMAHALIGNAKASLPGSAGSRYAEHLLRWEERAERHIRRNIGVVPGLINHYWHGRKAQRFYKERWSILLENNFDPDVDLKRDTQSLWQLVDTGDATGRSIRLRDQLRGYFRSRNEDGNEL